MQSRNPTRESTYRSWPSFLHPVLSTNLPGARLLHNRHQGGQIHPRRGFKDKNPNPTKQCISPFFGVLFGLCGRGWFDTWWSRASKQAVGRFVFEDYRVDARGVIEWVGYPMGYRRLLALMRIVLEEAGA